MSTCNVQGCYKLLITFCKLVDNLGQAVRTQRVDCLLADLLQLRGEIFKRVYTVVVSFSTQRRAAFSSRKGDAGLVKPRPSPSVFIISTFSYEKTGT